MSVPDDEYDSPWKEILDRFFEPAMLLLFPKIHADVDWSRGFEFLDTELRHIAWDAELGKGIVDKLVKVWRKNGREAWVLIHLEIQAQSSGTFTLRMYVYNYRIFDRFKHRVVSVAILADNRPKWRPDHYGYALWGFDAGIRFPIAKLTDFRARWKELETSTNPFAVVVLAHLKTLETKRKPAERLRWKVWMLRRLYEIGLDRDCILQLFRFIDWVMRLPERLQLGFEITARQIEEEEKMPYITPFEQHAIDRGAIQATRSHIQQLLEFKFGTVPENVKAELDRISDFQRLNGLFQVAMSANSLEEFDPKRRF